MLSTLQRSFRGKFACTDSYLGLGGVGISGWGTEPNTQVHNSHVSLLLFRLTLGCCGGNHQNNHQKMKSLLNFKVPSDSFPISHYPSHHSFLAVSNISLLASIYIALINVQRPIFSIIYIKLLLCFTVLSFPSTFVSLSLEHELLPLYDGTVAQLIAMPFHQASEDGSTLQARALGSLRIGGSTGITIQNVNCTCMHERKISKIEIAFTYHEGTRAWLPYHLRQDAFFLQGPISTIKEADANSK